MSLPRMKWQRSTLRSFLGSLRKCASCRSVINNSFTFRNFNIGKNTSFHLKAFYLGVTNEWLEAMALAMGIHKKVASVSRSIVDC